MGLGATTHWAFLIAARYHTDNSIEVKYYDHPERFLDKMAFSFTGDAGCESGGGVSCHDESKNSARQITSYKQSFLGWMLYNRWWFHKDRYGFTHSGQAEQINNPGRYLAYCCRQSMGRRRRQRRLTRRTSLRTQATRLKRGMFPRPTTTCRASTLPSAGNTTTGTRMCLTGAVRVESHRLRAATTDFRNSMRAAVERRPCKRA